MTTEAELRDAVDALGTALAIVGCGAAGRVAVQGFDGASEGAERSESESPQTVLVAVDADEAAEAAVSRARRAGEQDATSIVVAAVPPEGHSVVEDGAITALRDAADTVLFAAARPSAGGAAEGLRAALDALHRLVSEAGVVNLDIADLETVLSAGDLALFTRGQADATTTAADRADDVVSRALADAPGGFGVEDAPTVLVHVVCGPGVSVTSAGAVVDAVRADVAADAHVIWGATVDEALPADALGVDLVVGGVVPTAEAGDPCPRCGATIVEYTLGERSTVACDACGYAGVTTELR